MGVNSQRTRRCLTRAGLLTVILFLLALARTLPLPAQIVRGQVTDSITMAPVSSAQVVLLNTDGVEISRTLADIEGLFLLRTGEPGEYRLRVDAEGYDSSDFPYFTIAQDDVQAYMLLVHASAPPVADLGDAQAVIERACPGGVPAGHPVLIGLVTDGESQEPAPGAEVRLSWSVVPTMLADHVTLEHVEGAATTGSTGYYAVCGAPPGTRLFIYAVDGARMSEIATVAFVRGGVVRDEEFTPFDGAIWRQDFELRDRTARTGMLSGIVTDTMDATIQGAAVSIVGTTIETRTNFLGSFTLENLPAGNMRLQIEQIGFRPIHHDVALLPGERIVLERDRLQLVRAPTELPPITVEAAAPDTRRDLSEFFKRRESTTGSFLTREEFERMGNVRVTTDVLRRMRGIYIRAGTGRLEYLITTRRGMGRTGLRTGTTGNCFPLVYLDRIYLGTTVDFDVNAQVPVVDLEAVEVHSSAASLPPEFNRPGASCGVIVFWTR